MQVPQWVKPAFWGVVVGALGMMIIGFSWWGWVLGSTAERMATERAGAAVTAVLVPICVERFMGQADAAVKLEEFQRSASWQQSQLIEKGGALLRLQTFHRWPRRQGRRQDLMG